MERKLKYDIVYKCRYQDEEWYGTISKYSDHITYSECQLTGRGSLIKMYMGYTSSVLWVCFPDLRRAAALSHPDDVFWNKEELSELFMSIIDGTTIAESIKVLNA